MPSTSRWSVYHPLGCSGALSRVLNEQNGQFGVATMCTGMGQGVATGLEQVQ